ncbi:MAG: M48 family metalloprotease, partial [Gemmatimonadaceae bacterium]
MDPQRYEQLVSELEALARTRPEVLRRRVRWLVALGYAYVLLVLGLVVVGGALLVWAFIHLHAGGLIAKLAIPLVGLAAVIVRALWVKVDPPAGRVLAPGTAPALETRVEEIRRALDAPRVDTVLLTTDFNASVTQVPRLGVLGWPKTYLSLGIPLMLATDPRELDAVLGHEFGHLSGAHPKLGLWVYRMSRTWDQLLTKLQQERRWGHKLFEPFVRWYAPRTQAYGFVLSRRDEFEADADAARVVSPRAMADALVALEVGGMTLSEHVWPRIWRRVEEEPQAPARCWSALVTELQSSVPSEMRTAWLGSALARRASDSDTHPSLKERLAALGVGESDAASREVAPTESGDVRRKSAAEHYLGELTPELLAMLDDEWHAAAAEHWRDRHEELKKKRGVLAELESRERVGETLSAADLWTRASVLCDLDEQANAIPALRALVALEPDHQRGQILLGRLLLTAGDDAGIAHVRRAMALSSRWAVVGASGLYEYYSQNGLEEEAHEIARFQREHAEELRLASEERQDFKKSDTLLPMMLPPALTNRVRGAVQYDERVDRVLIAQKAISHLLDYPMMVVVVVPSRGRKGKSDVMLARDVLGHLDDDSYVHLLVVVATGQMSWLQERIEKI